jgi:hypothetical protein
VTRLTNTFDVGTTGTAITTVNSDDSGDAFDNVQAAGSSTVNFNAANARWGGMCAEINPAASTAAYVSFHPSPVAEVFCRVYVKFPTLPADLVPIIQTKGNASADDVGRFTVQTDGRIRLVDGTATTVATTPNDVTGKLVAGSYARLEARVVGNAGSGVLELKLFLSPESTTPDSVTTATSLNTFGLIDRLRVGQSIGQTTDIAAFYLDDLAWDTTGYIGPQFFTIATPLLDNTQPNQVFGGPVFTPKAQLSVAFGFIDGSGSVFTPNVRRGINVPLLDASGSLFTPAQATLIVTYGGAFQEGAFQHGTFQLEPKFYIDYSGQVLTPRLNVDIRLPGPGSALGFQENAFQQDTFQQGEGGIDASGVVFTPAQVNVAAVGVKTLFPDVLDASGALFTPKVNAKVTMALIDQSGALFTFGGSNIISFGGAVAWDSPDVTWDDAGVVWDSGGGGGGIINASGQLFAPAVKERVVFPLLDGVGVLFTPTVAPKNILAPLLSGSPFLLSPVVAEKVVMDLLDAVGEVIEFDVLRYAREITPDLLDGSGVLYTPTVNPIEVDLDSVLDASGFLFQIEVHESVAPPLLDGTGVVFTPLTGDLILPGLLDASGVVLTPQVEQVRPDLLDGTPVVFEPENIFRIFPQTVRFEFDEMFLDATGIVYEPFSVELAPPQTFDWELLDATPLVFGPRIFVPTRPTIVLHARYDPITIKHARYVPVILKHAQQSRQG